jgi:catechol 2,3-dioxygenase-like lactoylglutathione lyase family enzyme
VNNIKLAHIALQCTDELRADIFFRDILGLQVYNERIMPADKAEKIFGIKQEVIVKSYSNESTIFEIFITDIIPTVHYGHVCIFIGDKDSLIKKCIQHGIHINKAHFDEKDYLFIRDFSGNLYEIK